MNSRSYRRFGLVACLIAGASGTFDSAQAAVYLEANYSDFAGSGALQTLLLEVGSNTVTGRFGYSGNGIVDFGRVRIFV